MYIEHPFKYDGVYYAKVDGELIEITREQAKVMLSFYRNYKNYDKKWGCRGEEDNDDENSEQKKKKEKEELNSCKELMDELEQEEKEAEKKAAEAEAVHKKTDQKAYGKKKRELNRRNVNLWSREKSCWTVYSVKMHLIYPYRICRERIRRARKLS